MIAGSGLEQKVAREEGEAVLDLRLYPTRMVGALVGSKHKRFAEAVGGTGEDV